jgi:DNA mismatch repair protein MSH6
MKTKLNRGTEFWDADRTMAELRKADYWKKAIRNTDDDNKDENNGNEETKAATDDNDNLEEDDGTPKNWPRIIKQLRHNNQSLALSALGGNIFYLRRLLLDKELVCLGNFHLYDPATTGDYLT